MQPSLGRWFDSASREINFLFFAVSKSESPSLQDTGAVKQRLPQHLIDFVVEDAEPEGKGVTSVNLRGVDFHFRAHMLSTMAARIDLTESS